MKMTPIYTFYESTQNEDGTWSNGRAIGVTCFSSKRKAEKAIHAHYKSMAAQKEGTDFEFHEKDGVQEPYFEYTRFGVRTSRWIAQYILV